MAFSNDIVGGTTLLRPAIRSPNYVAGVSGWTINRDGTSEFAGGTFRGAVIVIDPATGNVLASIGANGNGSFQSVYAVNDVIIGNLSVLSAITHQARGVVGYFKATTLPAPGVSGAYNNMAWVQFQADSTRQYRVSLSPVYWKNTNSITSVDLGHRLQLNINAAGNTQILQTIQVLTSSPDLGNIHVEQFFTPGTSGPAVITWQCSNTNDTLVPVFINPTDFYIVVEDVGAAASATGGTGSPPGTNTFTKQYFATASQVYDSSFNSESDPNNLYIGQLSGRTHGSNENSLWCFPGSTIRSDVSGATSITARLYMYCTGSSTTDGSVFLSWMTNTTPPASIGGAGSGGSNRLSVWPSVPSWSFVDITADLSSQIVANSMNAAYLQKTGLTGSCSWYGQGNATFKPYIQVTYTK